MKLYPIAAVALLAAPAAYAAEISVSYDPEFAEELTEDYGEREGEYLADEIRKDISRELEKAGVDVARIDVTIIDAKPNKPTFKQLGDTPGLDFGASKSIGGMKLSAAMFNEDGSAAGELTYDWYETSIRNAGLTTWGDAGRASNKFAHKLAKQLKEPTEPARNAPSG